MSTNQSNIPNIRITDNALKQVAALASKEGQSNAMLRIVVEGGGCSGFQYRYVFPEFEIKKASHNADLTFSSNDGAIRVLIDPISAGFMQDAVVDYVETLGSAAFEIQNPNTTARCGCGNSFNV